LLIKGLAPLALITQKLAVIEPEQLLEFLENAKGYTRFCFFRPDAEILIPSIIMCARMILSSEQYDLCESQIVKMGIRLAYLAACHYAPKVIECVENNFYPVQPADPKSYKLGLGMVGRGLFSIPAPYSLQTGAAVLAAHDVPFLIKKLRLFFTLLDVRPVECLQTCSLNAQPLICTLISEGNLYALQQVFALLTPQQQKELILTEVAQGDMPIAQAIIEGNLSILNYFLELKQDNNTPLISLNEDVIIALWLLLKAVRHDQVEAVKALVSAGADITLHYQGNSWLHIATRYDCFEVIKYLAHLKKDENYLLSINGRDQYNYTPLMQAVCYGKKAAMTALLDLGADATLTIDGCNLLHLAVRFKQFELISFILSLEGPDGTCLIDVNQRDDMGSTALMRAFDSGGMAVAHALIAAGADVTVKTARGASLLHIAAECGHLDLLSFILNCKQEDGTYSVPIDHQSQDGWTAIMWAVNGGHRHIFTALVAAGANLKLTTIKGDSLLHVAGNSGQADFIRLILDCKEPDGSPTIDVNLEDGDGFTALMRAVYYQQKTSIISLIAAGAKLHTKSNGSLLHMAVSYSHADLIPFLLDLKCSDGTALVDINQQDIDGRTALMRAVYLGNFAGVQALIAIGAEFSPVGHDLFIDQMNPIIAAALLNVISAAQALQMLLFKNKEGLSAIQRFVAIVKDGGSEALLKAILSKLQKEERITLITTLSNEEKNLLFYATPKARTLLCDGFSQAELIGLDPTPISQHTGEPAFKRRKIESIASSDSTSFGNVAPHSQALNAGLCLLSPPSASSAIGNTASSADPNKMDEAEEPPLAIGSKRKHPEDDLPGPGI
jgi:ankyrin repeat protein